MLISNKMIVLILSSPFTLFSNPPIHFSYPPKPLSNCTILRDSERILYSAHTYTLSCYIVNIPTTRPPPTPLPAHPCHVSVCKATDLLT